MFSVKLLTNKVTSLLYSGDVAGTLCTPYPLLGNLTLSRKITTLTLLQLLIFHSGLKCDVDVLTGLYKDGRRSASPGSVSPWHRSMLLMNKISFFMHSGEVSLIQSSPNARQTFRENLSSDLLTSKSGGLTAAIQRACILLFSSLDIFLLKSTCAVS